METLTEPASPETPPIHGPWAVDGVPHVPSGG